MPKNQEPRTEIRSALYVDGFNLYYPIHKRGEPWLKWLNLWKLGEILAEPGERLVKVLYCTAKRDNDPDARDRHNTYMSALRAVGVQDLHGHYITGESHPCDHCGMATSKPSEKQTDINLALSVILDGIDNVFDKAYLLSADSDQAATARVFNERYPHKTLVSVAPPNQTPSRKVVQYAPHPKVLTTLDIERSVFHGPYVIGKTGHPIRRPVNYDPPDWWMHPDDRSRKNK